VFVELGRDEQARSEIGKFQINDATAYLCLLRKSRVYFAFTRV
jgi:hypothetical protein